MMRYTRKLHFIIFAYALSGLTSHTKAPDADFAATISAHDLWLKLQKDEVKFKKKYFLATVRVTGVVKKQVKMAGISQIWLADKGDGEGVVCCQLESGSKFTATVGQKVLLEGMVGAPLLGFVRIQMCKLISKR
jgi:tRNA_anti-like